MTKNLCISAPDTCPPACGWHPPGSISEAAHTNLSAIVAAAAGSADAGIVCRAVSEYIVHVHLSPGLEATHHLAQ